jgi:hypothetical protein
LDIFVTLQQPHCEKVFYMSLFNMELLPDHHFDDSLHS